MLLNKLQSRKQSVLVAALAAQIAAPEVDLKQLTSSQRGVLLVALTAHLGKLKERSSTRIDYATSARQRSCYDSPISMRTCN